MADDVPMPDLPRRGSKRYYSRAFSSYLSPGVPSSAVRKRVARRYSRYKKRTSRLALPSLVERKFVDQVKTSTALNNTWTGAEVDPAQAIGSCVQGDGESNRDGTKIVVKSVQMQGTVARTRQSDQADVRKPTLVQVALVMDMQTNGAQLNAEDVFVDTGPIIPARHVLNNTSRFRVLRTQVFRMFDTAAGTDGANTNTVTGNCYSFRWWVPMTQVVNFVAGAGAGTIADFKDVSFHIIAASTGTGSEDTLEYNSRVRFIG